MWRKSVRWSTCILVLLNGVLLLLLFLPKRIDPSTIPSVGAMEGRLFKAESAGGKVVLDEIGHYITRLEVRQGYVWLYGDDMFPSIWDWEVDMKEGCLLNQNASEPLLRLEDHGSYLSLTGLESREKIYFVED